MSPLYVCFAVLNVAFCSLAFMAVLSEYLTFSNWEEVQNLEDAERPLYCFNKPQYGLMYQHGKYWVVSNTRISERSINFHCSRQASITMQGYYTDVKNLLKLGNRMFDNIRISFAVYVPNKEHAMHIVDIIRYAEYCQPSTAERMAIHLYFQHDQNFIDMANLRRELGKPNFMSECFNLGKFFAKGLKTNVAVNESTIIVGRNIAQLEAETLFVFPLAAQAVPSDRLISAVLRFLVHISRCKESERLNRTIFFLPMIMTNILGKVDFHNNFRLNVKEDVKEYSALNGSSQLFNFNAGDADWINARDDHYNCPYDRQKFSDSLQHLLTFPDSLLTLSNYEFPLLEENHQLSVMSSLRLRVFVLLLKNFEFIKHYRTFVLQNVSSFEREGDFKLSAFNGRILRQYRIMYEPWHKKRVWHISTHSAT